MLRFTALLLLALAAASPGSAADSSKCGAKLFVLWGDGKHDDSAALNAWFRGDAVVWRQNGRSVGAQISGRDFHLTAPIYISSGTNRSIDNFKFLWPERREVVAGGTIVTGADPNRPPVATGITKIGARPNEGVPFPSDTPKPAASDNRTDCLVS
ncbi:MAG: hypothetical protein WB611_30735 [Stellaceae bacterium]